MASKKHDLMVDSLAFEVELSDRDGQTFEFIGLRLAQIMRLNFEPASLDLNPEMLQRITTTLLKRAVLTTLK
jgi:hypothetical protein